LLAVLAIADNDTPIICNGFKDDEYIEMVMLAKKIGRQIIPVVEKYTELDLILKHSARVGVRPVIGLRIKLASRGSGRWKSSGGYRSKFGLTVTEGLRALEQLKSLQHGRLPPASAFPSGQPDHQHPPDQGRGDGSRARVRGIARAGAGCAYMDVGGGLGIDYDGSQTDFESSVNYTLQEYANDVVYHIQSVCDEAEVPHPTIVSESGRAVAAYHSVLVFNVLGVTGFGDGESLPEIPDDVEQPLIDLEGNAARIVDKNLLESFHDAQQALDSALNLFSLGYLPLATAELGGEHLLGDLPPHSEAGARIWIIFPEDLEGPGRSALRYLLLQFFAVPEHARQLGREAVVPHHADSSPGRGAFPQHGILGDISCDSDGKVDQFIDRRDVKKTLPLHTFQRRPAYILGSFLVGAYQEILGDLHNLFGDTNAVHVRWMTRRMWCWRR
jgi:arginine decarboxylase